MRMRKSIADSFNDRNLQEMFRSFGVTNEEELQDKFSHDDIFSIPCSGCKQPFPVGKLSYVGEDLYCSKCK
jgi:hypothetical protein